MTFRPIYISVDTEFDGPIPGDYSMLALGAVTIDEAPEQAFYCTFKPISERFIRQNVKICEQGGVWRNLLKHEGKDPKEGMQEFLNWLSVLCGTDGYPVMVALPDSPDWMFVSWYFHHFLGENPFGVHGCCIKSYFSGATGLPIEDVYSSKMRAALNIGFNEFRHTHNALDDAREQAEIFRRIRAHVEAHNHLP